MVYGYNEIIVREVKVYAYIIIFVKQSGSKTSADALNAGKPLITLPAEYLRGRMGVRMIYPGYFLP